MNLLDLLQSASNSAASNVSAPVDALAWLLRKAGVPVPEDAVGGSQWMEQKGLTKPIKQSAESLAGETMGLIGPMAVAAKAPQVARGLLQMGENAAKPGLLNPQKGAIVWHGSPHKFDKFDSTKIGTGEGAQAYGHGLYLAESPAVAQTYKDLNPTALASPIRAFKGAELTPGTPEYHAATLLDGMGLQQARKQVAGWISSARPEMAREAEGWKRTLETLNAAASKSDFKTLKNNGNIYKVDLPDDAIAKMLDWDKPLSQQAPGVTNALRSMVDDVTSGGFDLSRGNRDIKKAFNPTTKEQVLNEIVREYPHLKIVSGGLVDRSGHRVPDVAVTEWMQNKHGIGYQDAGQLYRDLTHIVGSDSYVSSVLRNNGTPGIRYLDGGSRGAGAGTSNFVVFPGEEGLLKILERNGQGL